MMSFNRQWHERNKNCTNGSYVAVSRGERRHFEISSDNQVSGYFLSDLRSSLKLFGDEAMQKDNRTNCSRNFEFKR